MIYSSCVLVECDGQFCNNSDIAGIRMVPGIQNNIPEFIFPKNDDGTRDQWLIVAKHTKPTLIVPGKPQKNETVLLAYCPDCASEQEVMGEFQTKKKS